MKRSSLRKLLVAGLVLTSGLGFVGYELASLQSGLEPAPTAAFERAAERASDFTPPPAIGTYDSFDVSVTDDLFVRVHKKENNSARGNILLIHGAGGGAWVWEEFLASMPSSYNLYAMSWRGHFDSSPVGDANSTDYVVDQRAVFDAIQSRNSLPMHVIGHSYGGATAVLMAADNKLDIASLHLLAPVVPLDYSVVQRLLVPAIAPMFIGTSNDADGVFGGMFLSEARMRHWYDAYASQPYSEEKPGLIAGDGISPAWQAELRAAYRSLATRNIPVQMLIAGYDNVVVPDRQRIAAGDANATVWTVDDGHYLQLGEHVPEIVTFIRSELTALEDTEATPES